MKDFHSLNQTQKVRLEAALHELRALSPTTLAAATVTVADAIPVNHEDKILRGRWTLDHEGELAAMLCGVVEWVDKLVYVRTLQARYWPNIHDIVIGRIIEIAQGCLRLEINFRQNAILMVSSINFPDGIQRRRTAVDELNTQSIFEENDIVIAEVSHLQHDGSPHLQAVGQKYGKLDRGQLLRVPAYLVKRQRQHCCRLEQYGVDLVLGLNGFIWVGEFSAVGGRTKLTGDQQKSSTEAENSTPLETRNHICRIANAVRVLSALGFTLTAELIIETVEASSSSNTAVNDMLGAEFFVQTAEREAKRRAELVMAA